MRIHVLSDLHFEVHPDDGAAFIASQPTDCDVLVLAGDICTKPVGIYQTLARFRKHYGTKPIVYVRGNHEHWGQDRNRIHVASRKARDRLGVSVLENEAVTIDGVRFLGTTLWFPRSPLAVQQEHNWCDFLTIPAAGDWLFQANDCARAFLDQEVRSGDVVVTHHLPTPSSIDPKFVGSPTNCYYVNELDDLILRRGPQLWIHGHTHCSRDYWLGYTRIVCNPYGYQTPQADHMNPHFRPGFAVEAHAPRRL
jgi:predicted phosphodiesterase